jgi:hypothetical protein
MLLNPACIQWKAIQDVATAINFVKKLQADQAAAAVAQQKKNTVLVSAGVGVTLGALAFVLFA